MKKRRILRMIFLALLVLAAARLVHSKCLAATRLANSGTALAIDGPGWFVVRDPVYYELFASRRGDFFLNESGFLVDDRGHRVQGFLNGTSGEVGDVRIDSWSPIDPNHEWEALVGFVIQPNGIVTVRFGDGREFERTQILLQNFNMPEELVRIGPGKFTGLERAQPYPNLIPPGSHGLGLLRTNVIEIEEVRWSVALTPGRGITTAQGAMTSTGQPTDIAIKGDGFFILRDTNTSVLFATRAGFFLRDGDGHLINYVGMRVQGWTDPTPPLSGTCASTARADLHPQTRMR